MHLQRDGSATERRMTNTASDLVSLVEAGFGHPHVLVVGDLMLDKYVWGDVERISPEAPVPVLRTGHHSEQPGGAANVAMNLAGLGAHATVIGCGGGDDDQSCIGRTAARGGRGVLHSRRPRYTHNNKAAGAGRTPATSAHRSRGKNGVLRGHGGRIAGQGWPRIAEGVNRGALRLRERSVERAGLPHHHR